MLKQDVKLIVCFRKPKQVCPAWRVGRKQMVNGTRKWISGGRLNREQSGICKGLSFNFHCKSSAFIKLLKSYSAYLMAGKVRKESDCAPLFKRNNNRHSPLKKTSLNQVLSIVVLKRFLSKMNTNLTHLWLPGSQWVDKSFTSFAMSRTFSLCSFNKQWTKQPTWPITVPSADMVRKKLTETRFDTGHWKVCE